MLVSVFLTEVTATYLMFLSAFAPRKETNSEIQGHFAAYMIAKLQLYI